MASDDGSVEEVEPAPPAAAAAAEPCKPGEDPSMHPLFWRPGFMPEGNEDAEALKAFIDEFSPEERATAAKDAGNEALKSFYVKKSKVFLDEAVRKYGEALQFDQPNEGLKAIILSNRSQVESMRGNWGNALSDAQAALRYDATNVKAAFRGARAAFRLERWDACEEACKTGLEAQWDNTEILKIKNSLQDARLSAQARQLAIKEREEKRLAPSKALAEAMLDRGYKFTVGERGGQGPRKPFLDEEGCVHFPVVFCMPEVMQMDTIEDAHEGEVLSAHVDVMFGADAPPLEWDTAHAYTAGNIELYYMSHSGTPMTQSQLVSVLAGDEPEDYETEGPQRYGANASKWVKVDTSQALGITLQRSDLVIPAIPMFFVVAKGTDYRTKFLEQELRRI